MKLLWFLISAGFVISPLALAHNRCEGEYEKAAERCWSTALEGFEATWNCDKSSLTTCLNDTQFEPVAFRPSPCKAEEYEPRKQEYLAASAVIDKWLCKKEVQKGFQEVNDCDLLLREAAVYPFNQQYTPYISCTTEYFLVEGKLRHAAEEHRYRCSLEIIRPIVFDLIETTACKEPSDVPWSVFGTISDSDWKNCHDIVMFEGRSCKPLKNATCVNSTVEECFQNEFKKAASCPVPFATQWTQRMLEHFKIKEELLCQTDLSQDFNESMESCQDKTLDILVMPPLPSSETACSDIKNKIKAFGDNVSDVRIPCRGSFELRDRYIAKICEPPTPSPPSYGTTVSSSWPLVLTAILSVSCTLLKR